MPVDEYGTFTDLVPEFAGMKVMDANKPIIEYLKSVQKLVKAESITPIHTAEDVKLLLFIRRCQADLSRKRR